MTTQARDRAETLGKAAAGAAEPFLSTLSPVFYLNTNDAVVTAMEHSGHSKLLAFASSARELFATWTDGLPVAEAAIVGAEAGADPFARRQLAAAPSLAERLLDWDSAAHTVLIDKLPYVCTQLLWGPWQHGILLCCVARRRALRLYRYSHGRWGHEETIAAPDTLAAAFSVHLTLACGCANGKVELWAFRATPATESGRLWTLIGGFDPRRRQRRRAGGAGGADDDGDEEEEPILRPAAAVGLAGGGAGATADVLCVSWCDKGVLLACGDQAGVLRVYTVIEEGTMVSHVAFEAPARPSAGTCRHVSWAPSAGRSFLVLAAAYDKLLEVLVFRRPCGAAPDGGPAGLVLITRATAAEEPASKLTWNSTGTRLVTSHADSSVHVWALRVAYCRPRLSRAQDSRHGRGGSPAEDQQQQSGGAGLDDYLSRRRAANMELQLSVSIDKLTSVVPYHSAADVP